MVQKAQFGRQAARADDIVSAGPIPPAGLCNGTSLRKATRRVSQLYDAILAPCGLRSTQRSILIHIARAGTPNMGALAGALVLDRSALAHNLKPLERDGLIEVTTDPKDRRTRLVGLTNAGRRKLAESASLWERAQFCFEAAFGPQEAQSLRASLAILSSIDFAQTFQRIEDSQAIGAPGWRG